MKYYTQQWWHDGQKAHIQYMLKASDEAKDFSEEYFQRLYQEHMDKNMTGYLEFADEDDLKRQSAEEFASNYYLGRLSTINRLPTEIKDVIADIRVAALGFVTQDVLEKIKAFCENISVQTKTAMDSYRDYYNNIKGSIPKQIEKPLSRQHEARIKKIGMLNGDYIIETKLGYSVHAGYTEYTFKFKNASVLQDMAVKGDCLMWDYTEIYLRDGGYEVHILFHVWFSPWERNQGITLTDVIIFAEDIEVEAVTHEPESYTEFL